MFLSIKTKNMQANKKDIKNIVLQIMVLVTVFALFITALVEIKKLSNS